MFKKLTIKHNHIGLIFKEGKYIKHLPVGAHYLSTRFEVPVHLLSNFPAQIPNLERLHLENKASLSQVLDFVEASRDEIALVQKGKDYLVVKPLQLLGIWRDIEPIHVEKITAPSDLLVPEAWLAKLENDQTCPFISHVTIPAGRMGILKRDGKILTVVKAGKHAYFDIYPKIQLEVLPTNRAISNLDLIEEYKTHSEEARHINQTLQLLSVAPHELVILTDIAGPVDVCTSGNEYLVASELQVTRIPLNQLPLALPDWLMQALRNADESGNSRTTHFSNVLRKHCVSWEVPADHLGVLYVDGVMTAQLASGFHAYFSGGKALVCKNVDQRLVLLEITGQEILSQDKVPLRVNVTVGYQVQDAVKTVSTLSKHEEFIYKEVQFALRAAIGSKSLDALLENKNILDIQIQEYAAPALAEHGIHLQSAGIKDLILPGEIRAILSKVVEAEKTAQANVIRRREETASTRSLLNTAKVMEDSPIALRMKELETLERVCEKIDKISVFGGLEGVLKGLVNLSK